jgi:hypothetical protein
MSKFLAAAMVCLFLSGIGGGIASAKQCRDAHGKFVKCKVDDSTMHKHCRDAKGKFVKCGSTKKM